jgi:cell division GTPase FtsZ
MKARIIVLGVGGAGGNAVNNMIASATRRRIYRR